MTLTNVSSKVSLMGSTIYSAAKWPALLKEIPKKARPGRLFIKGTPPPKDALIISIVGTRNPTSYGRDAAHEIARELAGRGIILASGLAMGIDSIIHRAALEAGAPTLAVLGSGLNEDVLYPKENLDLAQKIVAGGGALISEYEDAQKPELWTFPQRNRIIAGIAKVVIVIEAGEKSGALITARFAAEFGREVMALPGSIFHSQSAGTNALIKDGASPITSADDVFSALGLDPARKDKKTTPESAEEAKILNILEEELPLDEIIKRTGIGPHAVLSATAALEIRGAVKNSGGLWRKT